MTFDSHAFASGGSSESRIDWSVTGRAEAGANYLDAAFVCPFCCNYLGCQASALKRQRRTEDRRSPSRRLRARAGTETPVFYISLYLFPPVACLRCQDDVAGMRSERRSAILRRGANESAGLPHSNVSDTRRRDRLAMTFLLSCGFR